MSKNPAWLDDCIIYQIYPQSFYDTNNDGIGDLNGIKEKLPYIKSLGVNAIWLNPFYESPFDDAGYDISDYYKVAPRYGTNEDFVSLCESAHNLGIKVICDLVPGHTSITHPWFKESSKKERNEYSDRYIWTNSKNETFFRMNVRDYERDGQYRCNFFAIQPSLNYGYARPYLPWQHHYNDACCIETRNEIKKVMDYWTNLGCDGFRADMANSLVKSDNDSSATIEVWKDIISWYNEKHPNCIMISEWGDADRAIEGGFNIDMMLCDKHISYASLFRFEDFDRKGHSYFKKEGKGIIYDFLDYYKYIYEKTKDKGFISIPTSSHDLHRITEHLDNDELMVSYVFIFTMPGIPILYYGDEIGMKYIPGLEKEGSKDRGGSRTPMQWNCNKKNFGFSDNNNPYLPVDPNPNAPCVNTQESNNDSLLNFTKKLTCLRHKHKALMSKGDFKTLSTGSTYPFGYERKYENETIHILLNPANTNELWIDDKDSKEILLCHNASVENRIVRLGPSSYIVYVVE